MKKRDIVKRIATQSGVSCGEAADRVGRVVHQILSDVRRGRKTSLPGLGTFYQGGDGRAFLQREGGGNGTAKN